MASVNPFPNLGFNFKVRINNSDIGFQEVSGLGAEVELEEIEELGNNAHKFRLPKRIKYNNVILKKGLIKEQRSLVTDILEKVFKGTIMNESFETFDVTIELMDDANRGKSMFKWELKDAYPVKWEIGTLNAQKSELVIETLELAYQYSILS